MWTPVAISAQRTHRTDCELERPLHFRAISAAELNSGEEKIVLRSSLYIAVSLHEVCATRSTSAGGGSSETKRRTVLSQ